MQMFYFKKTITIILQELKKKNYLKLSSFRFIIFRVNNIEASSLRRKST